MTDDNNSSSENTFSNVTHILKNKATTLPSQLSDGLQAAINRLNALRGNPDNWLAKDRAVSLFVAASLHRPVRIWAKGEWRSPKIHLPAVLLYNEVSQQAEVWVPLSEDLTMAQVEIDFFHCTIPHAGIAQEVYGEYATNDTL